MTFCFSNAHNGQSIVSLLFVLAVVMAIASRELTKAKKWAEDNGWPNAKAYGSYQELLDDSDIDAIYCPLPSGHHREWVEKILKAGKHLLLEKPISYNRDDLDTLLSVVVESGL